MLCFAVFIYEKASEGADKAGDAARESNEAKEAAQTSALQLTDRIDGAQRYLTDQIGGGA